MVGSGSTSSFAPGSPKTPPRTAARSANSSGTAPGRPCSGSIPRTIWSPCSSPRRTPSTAPCTTIFARPSTVRITVDRPEMELCSRTIELGGQIPTLLEMAGGHTNIDVHLEPAHAGWRLDRALAAAVPTLSRERLKVLIKSGAVVSGDRPMRDPATKVRGDERFRVSVPEPKPAHNVPQDIPLTILFEDEHLLVVDKPAGLVVHPAAGNFDGTLVNALLHHCGGSLSGIGGVARPGIVHRIDKDTSGLLVVAKTDVAHEGLARQFAAHSIDRRYLAIVSDVPKTSEGIVDASLARSATNRKKIAIVDGKRGKRALTRWKRLQALNDGALVECRLETGRTHQVRVHMASIGHPLVGDPVYGHSVKAHRKILNELEFHRQALHATELGFTHPVTKHRLSFASPMPADMQEL